MEGQAPQVPVVGLGLQRGEAAALLVSATMHEVCVLGDVR